MKLSTSISAVVVAAGVSLGAARTGAAQQPGEPYGVPAGQVASGYVEAAEAARQLVRTLMAENGIPGLSIAVGVDSRIVWSEGFGWSDVENQVPVTTLTKFRGGSTSKPITQAAASLLYEQGRFDFDAPVRLYVPSFPEKGYPITPRQLMAHTAGVRHYPPDGEEFYSSVHYDDIVDALSIFQDDPLLFEPGTDYSYSTYGANLLGAAVQAAAGEPFLTVLRKLVFEPLEMRSTVGDHTDSIISFRTGYYERTGQRPGYHRRKSSWGDGSGPGVLLNGPLADNSNKWAGGGLLTTPEDLVRFGSAHLQPGFLRAGTLEMIFTSARFNNGEETGRGLNWDIDVDDAGRRTVGHGGGGVGGTSDLLVYLDEKVVVAVQCNLTDADYGDLVSQVGELFIAAAGPARAASGPNPASPAGQAGR